MRRTMKDITGEKFGKLTVISFNEKKPAKAGRFIYLWNCQCDCGNTIIANAGSLAIGNLTSCGCEWHKVKFSGAEIMRNTYKRQAKIRGLDFELTLDECISLFSSDCVYCGCPPKNQYRNFMYNGIDRVDNTKGYYIKNCVSCCKNCNYAKRDLVLSEWLEYLDRLTQYRQNIGTRVLVDKSDNLW